MKNEIRYYFEFLKESVLKKLNSRDEAPRVIPPPHKSGWTKSYDETQIYWEVFEPQEIQDSQNPKPAIVLCYGLVCSMNQWRKQIERYSQNRRVILFDYRGHHRSETPSDSSQINISALARDLSSVLKATEESGPVHVWGHSMGVSVAIEFAVQEPERVKSLVLCCGSPTNPFANMFDSNLLDKAMKPLLSTYQNNSKVYDTIWSLFLAEPRMAEFVSMIAGFNAKASDKQDIQVYAKAVASVQPRAFFSLLSDL